MSSPRRSSRKNAGSGDSTQASKKVKTHTATTNAAPSVPQMPQSMQAPMLPPGLGGAGGSPYYPSGASVPYFPSPSLNPNDHGGITQLQAEWYRNAMQFHTYGAHMSPVNPYSAPPQYQVNANQFLPASTPFGQHAPVAQAPVAQAAVVQAAVVQAPVAQQQPAMQPTVEPASQPTAAFGIDPSLLRRGPVIPSKALENTTTSEDQPGNVNDPAPTPTVAQAVDDPVQIDVVVGAAPVGQDGHDTAAGNKPDSGGRAPAGRGEPLSIIGRHPSNANPFYGFVEGAGQGADTFEIARTARLEEPYSDPVERLARFRVMMRSLMTRAETIEKRTGCWLYLIAQHPDSQNNFLHFASAKLRNDEAESLDKMHEVAGTVISDLMKAERKVRNTLAKENTKLEKENLAKDAELKTITDELEEAKKKLVSNDKNIEMLNQIIAAVRRGDPDVLNLLEQTVTEKEVVE